MVELTIHNDVQVFGFKTYQPEKPKTHYSSIIYFSRYIPLSIGYSDLRSAGYKDPDDDDDHHHHHHAPNGKEKNQRGLINEIKILCFLCTGAETYTFLVSNFSETN